MSQRGLPASRLLKVPKPKVKPKHVPAPPKAKKPAVKRLQSAVKKLGAANLLAKRPPSKPTSKKLSAATLAAVGSQPLEPLTGWLKTPASSTVPSLPVCHTITLQKSKKRAPAKPKPQPPPKGKKAPFNRKKTITKSNSTAKTEPQKVCFMTT